MVPSRTYPIRSVNVTSMLCGSTITADETVMVPSCASAPGSARAAAAKAEIAATESAPRMLGTSRVVVY